MLPEPSLRARFVISLDFELYWGVLDGTELRDYADHLDGVRDAVPALLETFASHRIDATWATVGMLLAEDFDEALEAAPSYRMLPKSGHRCPYRYASLERVMPRAGGITHRRRHFARDLARHIVSTPGQELACHGYAHIGYLDARPDPDALRADLLAMRAIASRTLGVSPTSLVFPRNQFDDAAIAASVDAGFPVHRGTSGKSFEAPAAKEDERGTRRLLRGLDAIADVAAGTRTVGRRAGSIDVPGSRFFRPLRGVLDPFGELELRRIERELRAVSETGGVYHLWFHPHNFGRNLRPNLARLERILQVAGELREAGRMTSVTMRDAAKDAA